jgi:DNA-binding response OmpR family regulator
MPNPPISNNSKRVLVVDDDEDTLHVVKQILAIQGFDVRSANDGQTALATVSEFEPQAVLLDLGLPDMSGSEVARRLRLTYGGTLRIVAVTGSDEPEQLDGDAILFDDHMLKPVNFADLGKRLLPQP